MAKEQEESRGNRSEQDVIVGRRLRHARERKGQSTERIASLLDVSVDEYLNFELGSSRLMPKTLALAAQLLDVDLGWFFEDSLKSPAAMSAPNIAPGCSPVDLSVERSRRKFCR